MRCARVASVLLALAPAGSAVPWAAEDDPILRLEADLDALPPVASWPLRDVLVKTLTSRQGAPPADFEFPIAEVYRGDRAVLLAVGVRKGAEAAMFGFRKDTAGWQFVEELRGWAAVEEMVFTGPGEPRIVRRAGLAQEKLPLHLRYLRREWPRRMRVAAEARDWKRWGALFERGMAGVGLRSMHEALRIQYETPEEIEAVRLVRQEPLGARVLAEFEIVQRGRTSRESYVLARESGGWVIDHRYVPPVTLTVVRMRLMVPMLGAFAIDHGDSFPMVGEFGALAPLLTPLYGRELPPADAWGTPFRYVVGKDGKTFRVVSAGADKVFKPETWPLTGSYTDPAEDIVMDDTGTILRQWQPPR